MSISTPTPTSSAHLAPVRPLGLSALVALLVLGLHGGCGGRQPARPEQGAALAAVRIDGNEHVGDDMLRGGLALSRLRQRGLAFDPYLVAVDQERIRGVYLRRGFFQVEVTARVARRPDGSVEVRFRVTEGPRANLARVEIAGLPEDGRVTVADIRELVPLADGDPFVYERYDEARPALVAPLERAGYAHARLEATVAADRVRNEAIIRLEYTPGPLARFGAVTLQGTSGALAEAARARVTAKAGRSYSTATLAETQAALYDMGRFATVRVEPDRSAGGAVVPVTITVVEATRHESRLGGGVGVDPVNFEVRGRAVYRVAGWPGPLVTTHLELRPAYVWLRDGDAAEPRVEAISQFERMDLLWPHLRGEVEASFEYIAVEAYTTAGPRLRLGLSTPLGVDGLQLGVGWRLRVLGFSRIDEAIDEATRVDLGLGDEPYVLGFYEQNFVADLRDDPIEPRLGAYGELRLEEGTRGAGGEFDYLRVVPELRGYLPLGPVVLAARGRAGAIVGDLPVTQRFYAGGASSQRGFPERRLAPTVTRVGAEGDVVGVVVGGGALAELSGEARFPLGSFRKLRFGGVVFLDGADVTERLGDLDATNLHWAVGAGVRVATPVGPVRLDLGFRLNRHGPGEPAAGDRFAFHLSLGEVY